MSAEVRSLILKRHVASIAVYFVCNLYVFVSSCYSIHSYEFDGVDTWWAKFLKLLFCSQGYVMPALRCVEPAFLSVIKRQARDIKAFLTCDYCRKGKLSKEDKIEIEETDDLIYMERNQREASKSVYKDDREDEEINNLMDTEAALKKLKEAKYKKEERETLSPLFVYLSSSFNVELVYIILKGITKFSYISCFCDQDNLNEEIAKKAQKLNVEYLENGDAVLTIDQLKMKDFASWD